MNWRERIERDPQSLHGKPRVRGTRIPVEVVLDNLAAHVDLQEVLASYPSLSEDDVRACVAWAAECVHAAELGKGRGGMVDADFEPLPDAGKVEPEEVCGAATLAPLPARGAPTPREPMLYDLLILGPNVGEDSDFERRRPLPRELSEWGT